MADPPTLTKEYILSRLLSDPAAGVLNGDFRLGGWHDDTSNPKPAAVLVPLVQHRHGTTVLLTQRTDHLHHHPGQVSFPGGRMEEHDSDVVETALRETQEEVGIPPESVAVIGYLPPMPTVTGYAVSAVVGLVSEQLSLEIDHTEVEYAFEVPLEFLLDPRNERALEREYRGRRIPTVEFHYEGEHIWGATAHMLVELRKILLK